MAAVLPPVHAVTADRIINGRTYPDTLFSSYSSAINSSVLQNCCSALANGNSKEGAYDQLPSGAVSPFPTGNVPEDMPVYRPLKDCPAGSDWANAVYRNYCGGPQISANCGFWAKQFRPAIPAREPYSLPTFDGKISKVRVSSDRLSSQEADKRFINSQWFRIESLEAELQQLKKKVEKIFSMHEDSNNSASDVNVLEVQKHWMQSEGISETKPSAMPDVTTTKKSINKAPRASGVGKSYIRKREDRHTQLRKTLAILESKWRWWEEEIRSLKDEVAFYEGHHEAVKDDELANTALVEIQQ